MFKIDALLKLLNRLGLSILLLYVFSMFVYPIFALWGDWSSVQDVWDRWQSLNVGMLAFFSSVTAFSISRYNAEKRREREFTASKAFLPDALSKLTSYFSASAAVLQDLWEAIPGQAITTPIPTPPLEFKEVSRDCIRHADPEVGEYLARILKCLQIHVSRLTAHIDQQSAQTCTGPDQRNLISCIYRLGELQAMVNRLFPFARSQSPLDTGDLVWEDFMNAYANLKFWVEDIRIDDTNTLELFTLRALERGNSMS